jgi:RNA polymerase sigma-70 factor (ECF subfamily)
MTTTATTAAAEGATTSSPHEAQGPRGRSEDGAAAARTEELYGRYGRTVKGLCRALLRDTAEAEDAAQQTFLSAHRALLNGTEPLEPAAWLATIARNECWARIRSRMREPLPVDEIETASLRLDPLDEAIRRADLAALWAAITVLPRQQRDALLLREFGGLSYDELAEALAVSGPAVESLLFRARTRLRVQLSAAYASFSGASWIEAALRLFAGGGAPVAAKVAALGVGAAAVGSSAVVVPHVLDNHTHIRPSVTTPAAVEPKQRKAAPTPVLLERVAPVRTPAVKRTTVVHAPISISSKEQEAAHHDGGGDGEARSNDRHDQQEVEHTTKRVSSERRSGSGRPETDEEASSHSSESPDAKAPEDGHPSEDGHRSRSEAPAPSQPATTQPAATVTTPQLPPLPVPAPPVADD